MSEAIQLDNKPAVLSHKFTGLLAKVEEKKDRTLRPAAARFAFDTTIGKQTSIDLTAVPEPAPSLGAKIQSAAEVSVLWIEGSFASSARRLLTQARNAFEGLSLYSKFFTAWLQYSAILLLMYATDNRKKGAIPKLIGVHLGAFAGGLSGVWASELISSVVPGFFGYALGLFMGVTLILAIIDMGKKLGALSSLFLQQAARSL